jgi:hypothetical protein
VPILKSATPNNLICLGERNPSPRCRERRCIRSGYDRAGEFRREQGSCSPSRGEPAKGCCSSARGDEFPRLIGSTAEGERQTSESSRRASAERRSFHPSPQRDRSGRRSAGRCRRHPARREFSGRPVSAITPLAGAASISKICESRRRCAWDSS